MQKKVIQSEVRRHFSCGALRSHGGSSTSIHLGVQLGHFAGQPAPCNPGLGALFAHPPAEGEQVGVRGASHLTGCTAQAIRILCLAIYESLRIELEKNHFVPFSLYNVPIPCLFMRASGSKPAMELQLKASVEPCPLRVVRRAYDRPLAQGRSIRSAQRVCGFVALFA